MALIDRIKRAAAAFADGVPGPMSCRRVDPEAFVEHHVEKSKKEQVFEWLGQRQAYLDDHYNGPPQSIADVIAQSKTDLATDLSLNRVMPEDHIRHASGAQYEWDEARGEFVLK